MKKIYLLFLMGSFYYTVQAQIIVTVTNPGNTTPALLPGYASLASALSALNAVSGMTGPVIFTLSAGSETAPNKGLTIGSASLNPLLSAVNTVTIIHTGNTAILNAGIGNATPASVSPDGILKITGADFITIDGLTLTDGNATNPATMEFGIALFKFDASDGADNNRIQNCIINMKRINNAAGVAPLADGAVGIGIYNTTAAAATTALTPTAATGSNSANQIYTNSITGGTTGIAIIGYAAPSPFAFTDEDNDIGGATASTGNTISNFGGGGTSSAAVGIRTLAQYNLSVRYNNVNNNNGGGINHGTTLRGIFINTAASAGASVNNNNVTVHGGGTTAQVSGIENVSGATPAGNTININNNIVTGDYLTATTGPFYGIYNQVNPTNVNIQSNNISNISYSNDLLAGTGNVYLIFNSGAAANVNIISNKIDNIARTGSTGGNTIGILVNAGSVQTVNTDTVSNITMLGDGIAGVIYGIQITSGTVVCNNNNVSDLACRKISGTGVVYGIFNGSPSVVENYNTNTVQNISNSGTGNTYGIFTSTATGSRTVSGNTVRSVTGAGLTVAGIYQASSSPIIFSNKIYDISSSSSGAPVVSGLVIASLGANGTGSIYNNLVGDIRAQNAVTAAATTPSVRGINLNIGTPNTNLFLDHNTVHLAAFGGTSFATAALFVTSSSAITANLTMRNNIFVNLSTPSGAPFYAAAYQRSSTALDNYNTASNKNLFYSGTPSPSNLIFFNGTNADQTLAVFKTRVAPRETASLSFAPAFISTSGTDATFLHIDPLSPSSAGLADAGVSGTGISMDYDGQSRSTPPDIGADEFTTFAVVPITIEYFRGSKIADANYIEWKVNCVNEAYVKLSLERSSDGRNFKSINDEHATNVRCEQGFNFTDNGPLAGVNYYRLKTTTPDGKLKYSIIVTLINREKGFKLISISPNPVRTNATLNISGVKGGMMKISVTDASGKLVMKQTLTATNGDNPVKMNFSKLNAGAYTITVMNDANEIKNIRFVK